MLEKVHQLYKRAKKAREPWENLFDEAYDYALPNRRAFRDATQANGGSKGDRNTDHIFDQTAVVGLQEFASRLQYNMLPPFARWARLVPGSEVPERDKKKLQEELDQITNIAFAALGQSSFDQEITESFLDLGVSQGHVLIEPGRGSDLIECRAVPLSQIFILNGADGKPRGVFYVEVLKVAQIVETYGDQLPEQVTADLKRENEDKEIVVIDAFVRDMSRGMRNPKWDRYRYLDKPRAQIGEVKAYEGIGASPWIIHRWNMAAGEEYGRGPLLSVLPTVRVVNMLTEFMMENAEWAVAGAYQADDDGVINPDTITLEPRTIIPRSAGSRGIEPIAQAGDIGFGLEFISHLQDAIKKGLYNERLGPREGTPPTATEVQERMLELARDIGSAFGRLQAELVRPTIERVLWILDDAGVIKMPKVDGKTVDFEIQSPLARAQRIEDVQNLARFGELVQGIYGPQAAMIIMDQTTGPAYLAERLMVPANLVRDEETAREMVQAFVQGMQQQQQGGMPAQAQPAPNPSAIG